MNDIKEKIKYFALKKLKSNLIITQKMVLTNDKGIILDEKFKVSESIVGNFLQLLYINLSRTDEINYIASSFNGATGNSTCKNSAGVNGTLPVDTNNFGLGAGVGADTYGTLIGTGFTAPLTTDFKIETVINNGVGAGQMTYTPQYGSLAPANVGSITNFTLQRIFTNNSGAGITVQEVAILTAQGANKYCIYRDLIAGGVNVLDTQSLTANIKFEITT